MLYPFGTAILVDLFFTSITFPRIQTLAESVKDSDKKGIAFGGWSMKILTAFWLIIQAFWHPCKVHKGWRLTEDQMRKKVHVDDVIENMCKWRQDLFLDILTEVESESIFQLPVKGFSFATWIVTCDLLATTHNMFCSDSSLFTIAYHLSSHTLHCVPMLSYIFAQLG